MIFTAQDVMDRVAALLNDKALSNFSYVAQMPYLNMAVDELSEEMELNNVPSTNEVSAIIPVVVGVTNIGGTGTNPGPPLPVDLVEIQGVYERLTGASEDFQLVDRVEFLPPFVETTESLIYWTWQGGAIQFLGATTSRDVRLNYIGAVIPNIISSTQQITVINAKTFLSYRTAALCAEFIGENKSRADDLNADALIARDRFLGINNKGRQSIGTRRRPFMSGYKVRSGY